MLCVGLTGATGSGKSTATTLFRELGVAVIDADTVAHELYVPGGELVAHLKMRQLWVGPDFALGRNREGDIPRLRESGQELGFEVLLRPVSPEELGQDCAECLLAEPERFRTIYTRRKNDG